MRHSLGRGTDVVVPFRVGAGVRRLGSVACLLIAQPFVHRHDGPIRSGGVIGDRQRIRLRILNEFERTQPVVEPENTCDEAATRMMCDKGAHRLRPALPAQVEGASSG
jgi:hypothetical protein